ncbi:MAG: hypothetical protein GY791_01275 [Alphaproteobacteria bacterium]|nr:hypothetical protein [Alphaproteobacteria bacterium]
MALDIQNVATAASLRQFDLRAQPNPSVCDICFDYEDPIVGLAAGSMAVELVDDTLSATICNDAGSESSIDFDGVVQAFRQLLHMEGLGAGATAMARAARRGGIPTQFADDGDVQLGQGCRRIVISGSNLGLEDDNALERAAHKAKTWRLLQRHHIPMADQYCVGSGDDAVAAAQAIAAPVVVKPAETGSGVAVSLRLTDADAIRAAMATALEYGPDVVVESVIEGLDYRLLIFDGRLIAAARRIPPSIVGDGIKRIRDLIDDLNSDPRREYGHRNVLTIVDIDEDVESHLAGQGFSLVSIPEPGRRLYLRDRPNLSTGGSSIDVTDDVHPENRDLAIRAARAIGLRVCGVDLIIPDISKSYREVGGAVCEVNGFPGLRMHYAPSVGEPRDVAGEILAAVFPHSATARIPVAVVAGANSTSAINMVAHIAGVSGRVVGRSTAGGAFVDRQRIPKDDAGGSIGAAAVLSDPRTEIAILEAAPGDLVKSGLGVDRCQVGAVLNVRDDQIAGSGVGTLTDLARVYKIVADSATEAAVLYADDPLCVEIAALTNAARICFVTMSTGNSVVGAHIVDGKPAVRPEWRERREALVLYDHGFPQLSVSIAGPAATATGRTGHSLLDAAFAMAIAHGLGISAQDIERGLETCDALNRSSLKWKRVWLDMKRKIAVIVFPALGTSE